MKLFPRLIVLIMASQFGLFRRFGKKRTPEAVAS